MSLDAVAVLARRVATVPWFATVGAPLAAAERALADDYLAALGFPGTAVDGVADWPCAQALADAPDWDRAWWRAEDALRQALLATGTAQHGGGALLAALTRVTLAASDRGHDVALGALDRAGIADAALARAAAGAATQAAYLGALAVVVDAPPDHAFIAKLRLFEVGRWPLGIVGGHFHVF